MPLGSNVATPRGGGSLSLYRLTVENHSKFNISTASRWILIELHTQHGLTVGKVAYCFRADRTGTRVAMATYMF